jgi:hypothetical protein
MLARLLVFLVATLCACPGLACSVWVEEHAATLILRAHGDAQKECSVDEYAYRQVIENWLRTRPAESAPITALVLGRAVTYPWLSQLMVDVALGQPESLQNSPLAKRVLLDPQLLQRLAKPFAGSHYGVQNLTYEKVLFGPADMHSSNQHAGSRQVPFDAQLWLQLNRLH